MKLDVFIKGETVDLCIPNEEFAEISDWYSWFNRPELNRFLEQGAFPNTKCQQLEFYKSQVEKRLLLIINDKTNNLGVISLSNINWQSRSCEIALVVDNKKNRMSPFLALESMSLVTKHAFEVMGIERISAGQHQGLKGWQQRMELIGYKVEGRHSVKFRKGMEVADVISIAITKKDYLELKSIRDELWDNLGNMKKRIKLLPKRAFVDEFTEFLRNGHESYYQKIWKL